MRDERSRPNGNPQVAHEKTQGPGSVSTSKLVAFHFRFGQVQGFAKGSINSVIPGLREDFVAGKTASFSDGIGEVVAIGSTLYTLSVW